MFNIDDYNKYVRTTLMDNFRYKISHIEIRHSSEPETILKNLVNTWLLSVYSELDDVEIKNDKDLEDYINNKGTKEYEVVEFLCLSLVSGYYKLSNIDIARVKEKQFGCMDCSLLLSSFANKSQLKEMETETQTELESVLRNDIDFFAYMEQDLCNDDLDNIRELLRKDNQIAGVEDKEILALLARAYNEQFKKRDKKFGNGVYKDILVQRYKKILGGAFGIDEYVGVYTGITNSAFIGIKNDRTQVIDPIDDINNNYHSILQEIINLDFSDIRQLSARQFDKEMIYLASTKTNGIPLYFPYKILEIIKKCSYKFNKQSHTYSRVSGDKVKDLDTYVEYVVTNILNDALDYLYKVHIYDIDEVRNSKSKDEVRKKLKEFLTHTERQEFKKSKEKILPKLDYFIQCASTAIIVDQWKTRKEYMDRESNIFTESIEAFRFKLYCPLKDVNYSNVTFCETLRNKLQLTKSIMKDFNTDVAVTDEYNMQYLNLEYIFDAEKYYAKPIFAYQALDKLLERQTPEDDSSPLSWQKILLGKNSKDELVTSERDKGSIHIQESKAHFIYAGSRSGKGVMCYNIFATAIASNMPLFYIDGKPDTSVVLKTIGEDIFALNAGAYDKTMDPDGKFNPKYDEYVLPQYMKESPYMDSDTLSYFASFKGIMLVLTMMIYANNDGYKYSKQLQDLLPRGLVLVLDEFTKYQQNFTQNTKGLKCDGILNMALATSENRFKSIEPFIKTYKKLENDNMKEEMKGDKANAQIIARNNEELANFSKNQVFDITKLYATVLYNAYNSLCQEIENLQNASARVWNSLQVFVIGQDLEPIEAALSTDDTWYKTTTSGLSQAMDNKKVDPLVSKLLKNLNPDFILGMQPDRPEYLAQNEETSITGKSFTPSKRMFAYRKLDLTKDNIEKIRYTSQKVGNIDSYLSNWYFFKPFLILNNSVTPTEENMMNGMSAEEAYELADKEVISNKSVPRDTLTEKIRKGVRVEGLHDAYIRSQYFNQCLSSCEAAGLTYDDLMSDNSLPDNPNVANEGIGFEGYINKMGCEDSQGSLNQSGVVANWFVQTVLGYPGTWKQYCQDMRPQWWVCPADFDEQGNYKSIPDRLNNSFFDTKLINNKFVEMFGDLTEDLQPYYANAVVQDKSESVPDLAFMRSTKMTEQEEAEEDGELSDLFNGNRFNEDDEELEEQETNNYSNNQTKDAEDMFDDYFNNEMSNEYEEDEFESQDYEDEEDEFETQGYEDEEDVDESSFDYEDSDLDIDNEEELNYDNFDDDIDNNNENEDNIIPFELLQSVVETELNSGKYNYDESSLVSIIFEIISKVKVEVERQGYIVR